jgi:hypothetical protein
MKGEKMRNIQRQPLMIKTKTETIKGDIDYITQPTNYKEIMKGEVVVSKTFPYKRRRY